MPENTSGLPQTADVEVKGARFDVREETMLGVAIYEPYNLLDIQKLSALLVAMNAVSERPVPFLHRFRHTCHKAIAGLRKLNQHGLF